jgi:hypothetical protein
VWLAGRPLAAETPAILQMFGQKTAASAASRGVLKMKKLFAVCAVFSMFLLTASMWAADTETVKGWVSDSMCAAKGASASHEACAKKCLEKGAKMVVVTDSDKKVLTVDNPDALKDHVGHHMAVTGQVSGDSIHVDSATML